MATSNSAPISRAHVLTEATPEDSSKALVRHELFAAWSFSPAGVAFTGRVTKLTDHFRPIGGRRLGSGLNCLEQTAGAGIVSSVGDLSGSRSIKMALEDEAVQIGRRGGFRGTRLASPWLGLLMVEDKASFLRVRGC